LAPADLTVTNLSGNAGTMNSLPWCIGFINTKNDPNNSISFDPNLTGVIQLTAAMPAIAHNTNIFGTGSVDIARVQNAPNFRIFTIPGPVTCNFSNLDISGGFADTDAGGAGGGIFNAGNLTLTLCKIHDNRSTHNGGGIYNQGNLTLQSSWVIGNLAESRPSSPGQAGTKVNGGGVYSSGGILSVIDSTIDGNFATGSGGGIYAGNHVTVTITEESKITYNRAGVSGGGLFATGDGSSLTMTGGEIGYNEAGADGGGVASLHTITLNFSDVDLRTNRATNGKGGGYYIAANATATFTNCYFDANSAGSYGDGGAYSPLATVTMTNCTGQPLSDFVCDT